MGSITLAGAHAARTPPRRSRPRQRAHVELREDRRRVGEGAVGGHHLRGERGRAEPLEERDPRRRRPRRLEGVDLLEEQQPDVGVLCEGELRERGARLGVVAPGGEVALEVRREERPVVPHHGPRPSLPHGLVDHRIVGDHLVRGGQISSRRPQVERGVDPGVTSPKARDMARRPIALMRVE